VLLLGGLAGATTHYALAAEIEPGEPLSKNHYSLVATAVILTFGIILLGSAYRLTQLRSGGIKVAETLGGSLVTAQSTDLLERRVVNIVEEMAIAAGLPVPPVYVLQRELGINAFAAGWSPDDAVIGVTKGALEALNRDQLQGVIAHEFSHILNRDCALNMRLMGVLHGIVLISIIGRVLMRAGTGSTHRSRKDGGTAHFFVAGLAIWLFGSLGVLVARSIQAAVSRQREYLADASAVQFTRNPDGIAGALATIGSQTSFLESPRGGETSHMLIGEPTANSFLGALASHPPLFDRIKRILPRWSGEFAELATPPGTVRKMLAASAQEPRPSGAEVAHEIFRGGTLGVPPAASPVIGTALLNDRAGASASPTLDKARRLLAMIPSKLRNAAEDPFSARALILAWVLDADASVRTAQMAAFRADGPLVQETDLLLAELPALDPLARLPLFDIAVGTLASLSDRQREEFHAVVTHVLQRLSDHAFRSYCLGALALRHLRPTAENTPARPVLIKQAIEILLGILASAGHDSAADAQAAFQEGASHLGKRGGGLTMPEPKDLTVTALDSALGTLLRLPLRTKTELLTAAEIVATHDGVLRPEEAELLRAMATCLNVAAVPAFASAER
jgi:Zn-dependent protease with chaperone function